LSLFILCGLCVQWGVLTLWLPNYTTELNPWNAAREICSSTQKTSVLLQMSFKWQHTYTVWVPASTIFWQKLSTMWLTSSKSPELWQF
jgi:hypothetical protein